MPQLAQRLGLYLTDALTGDVELLADLFQRARAPVEYAEAQFKHLLLARGQRVEHGHELLLEQGEAGRFARLARVLVGDEVAEVAVLLLAYRGLEADGLLSYLEYVAHLVHAHAHLFGDLLWSGVVAELLQ